MVSASFANEQYRSQEGKATRKRNSYQKVIICAGCPIFVYGDAIFALPGTFFFGYSGAIFERPRSLFIDYSGAEYVHFAPKIVAAQKSLFQVVEKSGFADRLRNSHLEKSAVTGLFCA